jgi:hypothetical protein
MRNKFSGPLVCSALVCAAHVAAQSVGAGVKLGTTFTDALSITGLAPVVPPPLYNQTPFIVGPYVELRLPLQLAVEVDALYNSAPIGGNTADVGGSTWQFPAMVKYKLLKGPVRPYIEGGVSFSRISSFSDPLTLLHKSNYGGVLGIGVEIKLRALRITPELRYNYWALTDISAPVRPPYVPTFAQSFQSERNQVSLLVGFGF